MIKEDYVSYEVAKLLKEKGMNKSCFNHYVQKNNNDGTSEAITVCTLQMAMKWLREKYNIYISIQPDFPSDKDYKMCWCCSVSTLHENCISTKWYQCYIETYEEACEAAIKYCLKNII